MPYLTPNSIPTETICRVLRIPNDLDLIGAISGALLELTYSYNWEQYGTETPEDTAQAMLLMVNNFFEGCELAQQTPAIIRDIKAQNTGGGGATSGSWQTRTLNSLLNPANHDIHLSANQFQLPPGRWLIRWSAPAFGVNRHQSRLFDVTGNVQAAPGSSETSNSTSSTNSRSVGQWIVDLVANRAYRIEHQVQTTLATEGYGRAANFTTEVYTQVELTLISN